MRLTILGSFLVLLGAGVIGSMSAQEASLPEVEVYKSPT